MFFNRDGEISAAFDGGVIGYNHAFFPLDSANACDDTGARGAIVIHVVGREGAEFQKGTVGINQSFNAIPNKKLAPLGMFCNGLGSPPLFDPLGVFPQLGNGGLHLRFIFKEGGFKRINLGGEGIHTINNPGSSPVISLSENISSKDNVFFEAGSL